MAIASRQVQSVGDWEDLCRSRREDARALLQLRRSSGAWLNAGFAVESCIKAAIMKKEGMNRWPDKDERPELWTHDLRALLKRLGMLDVDPKTPVAPALKTVLDWQRDHGYSTTTFPLKAAKQLCEAAFDSNGVIEWIASRYRLNI
jgi:hypothetical protein